MSVAFQRFTKVMVLTDLIFCFSFILQHSVLDEAITEAVCIVANTDKWTVELLSSERPAPTAEKPLAQEIACSDSVSNLLDSVQLLWNMKMPSDYVSVFGCHCIVKDKVRQIFLHLKGYYKIC